MQQPDPILVGLAHSQDPAAAYRDSRLAYRCNGVQPLLVYARADNVAVKLGRGIQVVVIGGKACLLQLPRLVWSEHSQRAADFNVQRGHCSHRFQHRIEFWSLRRLPPGRSHTEPRRPIGLGGTGSGEDLIGIHEFLPFDPGAIVRALRAVPAIFRTAASLNGEQTAHLHLIGWMKFAMDLLRQKQKIEQGLIVDPGNFLASPVGAHSHYYSKYIENFSLT